MKKAIIWLRVSTDQQEIESQRKDLIEKAKEDGFLEENLIPIEGLGASVEKPHAFDPRGHAVLTL